VPTSTASDTKVGAELLDKSQLFSFCNTSKAYNILPSIMVKNNIPAYVLGVGLTKFIKPRKERAYPEMGYEAGVKAMLDAQINYDDVETGVACYCYGDTTSGQRIFYQFGMSS
jgi:hypothetical protein